MVADTNVAHNPRAFVRPEPRPGFLARFWEWLMTVLEPVPAQDWSEPEPEPTEAVEAPDVTSLTQTRHPQGTPPPQPVHPPFAMQPASMAHVLDRMIHRLVDLRSDPSMTAVKAADGLRALNLELSAYARQELDTVRRMERNQAAAQAQAVLLAEAEARGAGEEVAAQAAAGMAGRAVHVAALEQTGTMPRITEEMPDPRAEEPPAPVAEDAAAAIPEPSSEFLTGEAEPVEPVEPDHAWSEQDAQAQSMAGTGTAS